MRTDWESIEEFTSNANRLLEIFSDKPKSNLLLADLVLEAENDQLFAFVLHLLREEAKCRSKSTSQVLPDLSRDYCTIDSWFKKAMAGLICDPFPTVEYLLKKQHKPSVYLEFDYIFAATKLLNNLVAIYDPNLEVIDASSVINVEQFEIYLNLPNWLRITIDSVFIVDVPRGFDAPFASGPSFRFELLNYVDFDSRTDFKSLPNELLDWDEGSDFGASFGKRWSRRLVSKSSAYNKINFDPLKVGSFPTPLPRSLEKFNLNFAVQLPESVGVEVLHENVFDESFLSAEFLDYSAFSVHFARFLESIPSILTGKLKNTDIFAHAPLVLPSKTGSKGSLASFRALLLATGVRGHLSLESLPPVDIHEILNFDSEGTSACLLLGLALSTMKTPLRNDQSKFLNKLFTMHLPAFQTSLGLEIPPILQLAATLSLGLLKFQSFDRGTAQLLMKELFRPLPLNVNFKPIEDSPLLSIISAFTLGMCLMGSSSSSDPNAQQFAADIQNQLQSTLIVNGNKTQHNIAVLIATAFININNSNFNHSLLPWSRSLPDLLDKPEGVVFWCHLTHRLCQWNQQATCFSDQGLDKVKLNFEAIFSSICNQADDSVWTDSAELGLFVYACQVLMANSVFLALKFAGTNKQIERIDLWIDKLRSFKILHNVDGDYFLVKIQTHLLTTYQYLLLCKCLIHSASADSDCWAQLRELMAHPLLFKYGNGKLLYSAIGFLFSGKGRSVIRTERADGSLNYLAISSLLLNLAPILPTSPTDAEYSFVPLLDALWPLAL